MSAGAPGRGPGRGGGRGTPGSWRCEAAAPTSLHPPRPAPHAGSTSTHSRPHATQETETPRAARVYAARAGNELGVGMGIQTRSDGSGFFLLRLSTASGYWLYAALRGSDIAPT